MPLIKTFVEHKEVVSALMSSFPNTDTYLNHLPPDAGRSFEVARDLLVVVLGVRLEYL
jgi:hypothetical protein